MSDVGFFGGGGGVWKEGWVWGGCLLRVPEGLGGFDFFVGGGGGEGGFEGHFSGSERREGVGEDDCLYIASVGRYLQHIILGDVSR